MATFNSYVYYQRVTMQQPVQWQTSVVQQAAGPFHKVWWNSAPSSPSGDWDAAMVSPSGISVTYLRRIKAMTHAGSVEKAGWPSVCIGGRGPFCGIWCGMSQGVQISVTFPLGAISKLHHHWAARMHTAFAKPAS